MAVRPEHSQPSIKNPLSKSSIKNSFEQRAQRVVPKRFASCCGWWGREGAGMEQVAYMQMPALPSDLLSQNLRGWGLKVCIVNAHLLVDSGTQPVVGTAE